MFKNKSLGRIYRDCPFNERAPCELHKFHLVVFAQCKQNTVVRLHTLLHTRVLLHYIETICIYSFGSCNVHCALCRYVSTTYIYFNEKLSMVEVVGIIDLFTIYFAFIVMMPKPMQKPNENNNKTWKESHFVRNSFAFGCVF